MMRKVRSARFGLLAALLAAAPACGGPGTPPVGRADRPTNVVLVVGDGFGVGAWGVGRAYLAARGERSVLDDAPHTGFVDTRSADALVTDSAAAATAWATGRAGRNDVVGEAGAPALFERLAKAGRPAGLVTTARVTHATPAPFYARADHRDHEEEIARQLVAALPAVTIGGGRRAFLPAGAGGARKDGADLLAAAREAGAFVSDSLVVPLPKDAPALLLLADSHLPHDVDAAGTPDLADLVTAAIARLEAEGPGWFLLVEEGRIDQAGHEHDAASLARDVARLDRAVGAILRAVDLKRTLVVVTADHATGNPNLHENAHPESLDVVTRSVEAMERRIFPEDRWTGTPAALEERALPILVEGAAHPGLAARDVDRLLTAANRYDRRAALGTAISRRFGVVFMDWEDHVASAEVNGHTGEPVPLRAWGVRAADAAGTRDHAALGRWLADVLGLDG